MVLGNWDLILGKPIPKVCTGVTPVQIMRHARTHVTTYSIIYKFKAVDEFDNIQYLGKMDINVVRTEQISPQMERWVISLPKARFMEFGFFVEALEGMGLHHRSYEAENLMEVDVASGMKEELQALLADLSKWS